MSELGQLFGDIAAQELGAVGGEVFMPGGQLLAEGPPGNVDGVHIAFDVLRWYFNRGAGEHYNRLAAAAAHLEGIG